MSQTDTSIFSRQINQLLLFSTLRLEDLNSISNQSFDRLLINISWNENLLRLEMTTIQIKLPHIGQKILFGFIIIGEHIDITLNEFSLTNKENLNTHPPLIHIVTEDITILHILTNNPLLGPKRRYCLNQVPILRCPFKLHLVRHVLHLDLELVNDFVVVSI